MTTKNTLRKEILEKRKLLLVQEQQEAENSLFQLWSTIKDSYKTDKVALYYAVNGEISTNRIISSLITEGSECFLPIISKNKNDKSLEFALFNEKDSLAVNRFGIQEPENSKTIELDELDIIFLPCVCFDSKGNRIGMGQGFYDETLNKLTANKETQLIVLAYDFQEVESCMPEAHDIKADACLTPNKFLEFKD